MKKRVILAIIGVLLLGLNITGLFTSLRNPEIYHETSTPFRNDITLSEKQVYEILDSDCSNRADFIKKAVYAINQGIAHYWENDGIDRYNLRIPIQENYILNLSSFILPSKFQKYEYLDYHRAIERGVGLCSEHAIILAGALYDRGIDTKIIGLDGHVVATAEVNEKSNIWWVVDPDYGVIIPYDIKTIEENPTIVKKYYLDNGYDEKTGDLMVRLYGKEGNRVSNGYGVGDYSILSHYFETASYIMIWVIPLLFLLPLLLPLFGRLLKV